MYAQVLSRASIPSALAGKPGSESIQLASFSELSKIPMQPLTVVAVWRASPSSNLDLPTALIVANGKVRDTLAWLSTYVSHLRPITAYCRVIDSTDALRLDMLQTRPCLQPFTLSFIGMALGELLSSPETLRRLQTEPLASSALASTLTFSLARAITIKSGVPLALVAKKWHDVRHLTKQRDRPIGVELTTRLIRILSLAQDLAAHREAEVEKEDLELAQAVAQLARGVGVYEVAKFLGHGELFHKAQLSTLDGIRPARLKLFDEMVAAVKDAPSGRSEGVTLLLGYVASRIAPGSLRHSQILFPFLEWFPALMLWYGLFSGFSRDSTLADEFDGAGRRAVRDLLQAVPDSYAPQADISDDELEVLMGDGRVPPFPSLSPSLLAVELAPAVVTLLNWQRNHRDKSQGVGDQFRSDERATVASELGSILDRLAQVRSSLIDTSRRERDPKQGDLFDAPNRRKRKRQ